MTTRLPDPEMPIYRIRVGSPLIETGTQQKKVGEASLFFTSLSSPSIKEISIDSKP